MIELENAGVPGDEQLPDLAPATLRRLSDQIAADDDRGVVGAVRSAGPRRIWLRRSALVAAAAAAAVALTSAVLPGPPAEAAGWLATPTLAEGNVRAELVADCQQMMDTTAPAVLVEQRGASSLTVLADSSLCLDAAAGFGMPAPLKSGGRDVVPATEPGADQLQVVHDDSLGGVFLAAHEAGTPSGGGYMGVVGRIGTDVRSVVVHAADQPDITASVQNGWFAAWWPSLERPSSLTVTTTTGSYRQAL